ncbi:MAG: beta-sandwich domain-containing protein [Oscillochloridaceae bacterium umkhey_bin13]
MALLVGPLATWAQDLETSGQLNITAGTEVICDNKDACFSKYESGGVGSWGYIQPGTGDSSTTYNQHAFWTYNSQNQAIDWGRWQPSLPTTGTYDIYIWYPHYPGIVPETNTARYQVHDASGDRFFTWNQATSYGGWIKLTSASCVAGTSCYVRLTDETSESTGTRRVWFDAVKFVLQAEPVFTVSGRILNSVGTGLAGVTVSDGTRTATTNSNGDYTLANVPAGSYTLTPSLSGYTFSPTSLSVSVSSNVSGQNFTGTSTQVATYSVRGRITTNTGAGLSGVTISDGTRTATTNSNGDYMLNGVPAGNYTLTPSLRGYNFSPPTLSLSVGTNVSGQNFTATQAADTTMPDGTMTSPQSGQTITAGPITLAADAWDNPGGSGIARVEFKVYHTGNWREAGTVSQSPYTVRWNLPTGLAAQELRFAIHVIDHAGNRRIDPGGMRLVNYKPVTPTDGGFKLPYPAGASYMCSQGNNNPDPRGSHRGTWAYAFDFGMPRGHTVVASRNGTVVAVKGNSTQGACIYDYWPHANFVRIRHIDGTDTLYLHLDSVTVREGEVVQRGQTIGRSGQTGYSCGAHLHVDRRNAGSSTTIPFSFLDVAGGVPRYGVSYTSGNHLGLASDTIAPVGTVRFSLNGQRPYQIQLLAEDDTTPLSALSMRLATTEADLVNAAWQPFAGTLVWDQPIVWVQFQDAVGNRSDSYADALNPTATSPLSAAFEVAPEVCEGAELTITNQTVPFCEQCQWQWDLGNGATSTEPEPISTRLSAGMQTISLNVANASSTSLASHQVTVLPAPTATFDLVRDGNTVTVTAHNADATSWAWDFGDGAVASGRMATHTYTNLPIDGEMPSIRLVVQSANSCTNESATTISPTPATNRTVYLPLVRR